MCTKHNLEKHLIPIAFCVYRNLITQNPELVANDGLEVDYAPLGESG